MRLLTEDLSQNKEMQIKMSFPIFNVLRNFYLLYFSIFSWLESDHVGIERKFPIYLLSISIALESDHVGIESICYMKIYFRHNITVRIGPCWD